MNRRVFAIAAHPDDIEFVMAGTLLHLRDAGYEIHYMNVANGCCGSSVTDAATTARIRRQEAMNACQMIGATFHESLANDLEIFYDRPTLSRLAAIMREVSPEIVLTHSPADYMEDHMNTCRLAVTAAFARGMPNFIVDPPTPAIDRPITVYHAQPHGNRDALGHSVRPDIFVDIGAEIETKAAMLAAHVSQKQWLDESQGLDSYIESMRGLSRDVGSLSGCFTYAEGWRRHSELGFCAADADPLVAALEPECVKAEPRR